MSKKKGSKDFIMGMSAERALYEGGTIASNFMPGGTVVGSGLELVGAHMDINEQTQQAMSLLGDTRNLTTDSPAFKKYVDDLSGLYEERLVNFGVGIAGGAAATGLVTLAFGPPGWIAGIVTMAAGTAAASYGKEALMPSANSQFLKFASELQQMGQEGSLSPEHAFVALAMNIPDARELQNLIGSFPPEANIKSVNDMVKALDSEQGRQYLRQAMVVHDGTVRSAVGAIRPPGGPTIAEQYADVINHGHMAGVDLLSHEKSGHVGMVIRMAETHQMLGVAHVGYDESLGNPNSGLPGGPFYGKDFSRN